MAGTGAYDTGLEADTVTVLASAKNKQHGQMIWLASARKCLGIAPPAST